jgi:hypothetical protein
MKACKPLLFPRLAQAALVLFLASCAGLAPPRENTPETPARVPVSPAPAAPAPAEPPQESFGGAPEKPNEAAWQERPWAATGLPERPVEIEPPGRIMGTGKVSGEGLALFLEKHNPEIDSSFVRSLANCYVQEAAIEGINHDAAFAQMCLETGFLRFGGLVTPDMNNFCGLGSIGPGQAGHTFPDYQTGVRAHIQHLKAYASTEPLNSELVDPRFRYVRRGSVPELSGLSGTWAADRSYSEKISAIMDRLYEFLPYAAAPGP